MGKISIIIIGLVLILCLTFIILYIQIPSRKISPSISNKTNDKTSTISTDNTINYPKFSGTDISMYPLDFEKENVYKTNLEKEGINLPEFCINMEKTIQLSAIYMKRTGYNLDNYALYYSSAGSHGESWRWLVNFGISKKVWNVRYKKKVDTKDVNAIVHAEECSVGINCDGSLYKQIYCSVPE